MRARALPAVVLLGAAAAVVAAPAPAEASSGCALSISAPPNASSSQASRLGASSVTVSLGQVTVCIPSRLLTTTNFTVKVKSDGFTTGGGTAAERIAPEAITYSRGSTSLVPGLLTLSGCDAPPLTLAATEKLVASCGVLGLLGDAYVSWTPTLTVDVSGAQVAGTYTGTITHSVA